MNICSVIILNHDNVVDTVKTFVNTISDSVPVGAAASEYFKKQIIDWGCDPEEVEDYIDDGMYDSGNWKIFITWPLVEHVKG